MPKIIDNDHVTRILEGVRVIELDDIFEDLDRLDAEIKWYQRMLSKAYSFIVDHPWEECDCNRCQWIREYHYGFNITEARDETSVESSDSN
jgi:hypothetical protein